MTHEDAKGQESFIRCNNSLWCFEIEPLKLSMTALTNH